MKSLLNELWNKIKSFCKKVLEILHIKAKEAIDEIEDEIKKDK